MKKKDKTDAEIHRLVGYIASIPRQDVPEDILPQVMSRIKVKHQSWLKKYLRQLRRSVVGPAGRAVMVGGLASVAFLVAVSLLVPDIRKSYFTQKTPSSVELARRPDNIRLARADVGLSKEVTFVAHLPSAKDVAVIGTFNNWDPSRHVMRKATGGDVFTLTVSLPMGRYVYAFLIDGVLLQPDVGALIQEDDGFGNTNSVLILEEENLQNNRESHERPL